MYINIWKWTLGSAQRYLYFFSCLNAIEVSVVNVLSRNYKTVQKNPWICNEMVICFIPYTIPYYKCLEMPLCLVFSQVSKHIVNNIQWGKIRKCIHYLHGDDDDDYDKSIVEIILVSVSWRKWTVFSQLYLHQHLIHKNE